MGIFVIFGQENMVREVREVRWEDDEKVNFGQLLTLRDLSLVMDEKLMVLRIEHDVRCSFFRE